jgi:hypothetical protein
LSEVEAVDADELAGMVDVDVLGLLRRVWCRARVGGVADDQAQALAARVDAVPSEHPPDTVARHA